MQLGKMYNYDEGRKEGCRFGLVLDKQMRLHSSSAVSRRRRGEKEAMHEHGEMENVKLAGAELVVTPV